MFTIFVMSFALPILLCIFFHDDELAIFVAAKVVVLVVTQISRFNTCANWQGDLKIKLIIKLAFIS